MAITSLENAKAILQINNTSRDVMIESMIPMIESFVKEYCNDGFTNGFPAGMEMIAIRMIGFNMNPVGVTNKEVGDLSIDFSETYPADILSLLNKYRKIRF